MRLCIDAVLCLWHYAFMPSCHNEKASEHIYALMPLCELSTGGSVVREYQGDGILSIRPVPDGGGQDIFHGDGLVCGEIKQSR